MFIKNTYEYEKFNFSFIYRILKLLSLNIFILLSIYLNKGIKVCVCSPGKLENRYIREFIEHYSKYGVDKIFLYDNNDINGEKFEDVINDYIQNGFVELINYREKIRALIEMMNDCYQRNYKYYDWLIFFEVDEFIYLKNVKNIKNFLLKSRFNECERIQLNWLFYTDNNFLFYDNRPLKERFKQREKKARGVKSGGPSGIKSILRGHIPNIKIECVHTLNHNLKSCDGFGRPKEIFGISTNSSDYGYYYIDHYYAKSTEEFINKINRGDVLFYSDNRIERIRAYFGYNDITKEKIDLIENKTGLNLSEIRQKFKSKIIVGTRNKESFKTFQKRRLINFINIKLIF